MDLRLGAPLILGLALALGPAVAWPDVFPEEELYGDAIAASTAITGLARFPDHVFYLFPLRCSRALVRLDHGLEWLGVEDLKVEDGVDELANYAELHDGPIAEWIGPDGPCQETAVYALAREVAAGVDLAAMPLAAQQAFFADDPRLFRSDFKFVDNPPYASTGSPLRGVHEVVHALRIEADALVLVLDQATYRFVDGSEQTLKLAHTRRPALPFRPMKPTKVDKYASSFARWALRQPIDPPPAPKLPESFTETETETETDAHAAPPVAAPVEPAPAQEIVPTVAAAPAEPTIPTPTITAPTIATPTIPEPTIPAPTITEPTIPAPTIPAPTIATQTITAPTITDAPEAPEQVDVASEPKPLMRRALPLAIAVVVGLGAVILLRRA